MYQLSKWFWRLVGTLMLALLCAWIVEELKIGGIYVFIKVLFSTLFSLVKGDLIITLKRFLIAYMLVISLSIPIGLSLGRYKNIFSVFRPTIEFFRVIPSAIVIPILLSLNFFGLGDTMKIFVIFLGALWPSLVNTIDGARNVDTSFIDTGKVYNLTQFQILKTIIFPASLPHILSGARISLSISLLLAITVEMLAPGSPTGIGYYILDMERSFKFVKMATAILLVAIIGILLNLLFSFVEKCLRKCYGDYIKPY